MLLFHFHTLHANALWKVPSRFPPRGTEGGGGERLGPDGTFQPSRVSLSPGEWPQAPSRCLLGLDPQVEAGTLSPRAMGADDGRGLRALERPGQDARALLQPPPRKFWSGAWSRGFLSVLSAAPWGNPKSFIRCPPSGSAFQVCAG